MLSVRNAEFVLALLLLFLFLMYRKIPRIKNLSSLFALLCLFACLWRIVGTLAKGPWLRYPGVYSCLLHATASLHGCFCCFCLDRERNGKSWFEIPCGFAASSTLQQHRLWISSLNARKTQVSFYEWISWAQGIYRIPTTLSRGLCSVTKNGFVFP